MSTFRSLLICVVFCLLSTTCVLQNKFILSKVLPSGTLLLFFQSVMSVSVLSAVKLLGIAPLRIQWKKWENWTCSFCYFGNVVAGLASLNLVSVPAFGTLKRSNIVLNWAMEYNSKRDRKTRRLFIPVLLMCGGVLLAGFYDLSFSGVGYSLGIISAVSQSVALETGKRATGGSPSDVWSVVYENSALALGFLSMYFLVNPGLLASSVASVSGYGWLMIMFNTTIHLFLNYVIFLNCTVNSPLAHVVTGNVKTILTTGIALIIFGVNFSALGLVGLGVNIIGAGHFSALKLQTAAEGHSKKHEADNAVV